MLMLELCPRRAREVKQERTMYCLRQASSDSAGNTLRHYPSRVASWRLRTKQLCAMHEHKQDMDIGHGMTAFPLINQSKCPLKVKYLLLLGKYLNGLHV